MNSDNGAQTFIHSIRLGNLKRVTKIGSRSLIYLPHEIGTGPLFLSLFLKAEGQTQPQLET